MQLGSMSHATRAPCGEGFTYRVSLGTLTVLVPLGDAFCSEIHFSQILLRKSCSVSVVGVE